MTAPVTLVRLDEELRVDLVAKRYMGSERDGRLEALLLANPGLSASAFAPEGATIAVPQVAATPKTVAAVYPWE